MQIIFLPSTANTFYRYTPHFYVQSVNMQAATHRVNGATFSKLIIKVRMRRLLGFYAVSIFIPSIFLLIVNSAALWILEPAEYRLSSSVFVTISFTLQWILISLVAPPSSAVRAIDIWMSFCTIHALMHVSVHVIMNAVTTPNAPSDRRSSSLFSTISPTSVARLRQIKPYENKSLYDALLERLAREENENTWTHAYWIMFSTRVVSPTLTTIFLISYWPFVLAYKQV